MNQAVPQAVPVITIQQMIECGFLDLGDWLRLQDDLLWRSFDITPQAPTLPEGASLSGMEALPLNGEKNKIVKNQLAGLLQNIASGNTLSAADRALALALNEKFLQAKKV